MVKTEKITNLEVYFEYTETCDNIIVKIEKVSKFMHLKNCSFKPSFPTYCSVYLNIPEIKANQSLEWLR